MVLVKLERKIRQRTLTFIFREQLLKERRDNIEHGG